MKSKEAVEGRGQESKTKEEIEFTGMTSTSSSTISRATSAPDEALFLSHVEALKPIPIVFHDAYQAPPHLVPSRIAVFNLDVFPPPEKKVATSAANLAEVLNVTFKSLKPAYSVSLPIQPADSIQHLKSLLTSQEASPLTGTTVRLLLKGKALADTKLVKDYDIKEGSVITVMMSAPANKQTDETSSTPSTAPAAPAAAPSYSMDLTAADRDPVPPVASPSLGASTPGLGHKRRVSDIPAVTLSPAGTPAATTPLLQPISLTSDPLTHLPLTPAPTSIIPGSPSQKANAVPIDLASIPLPLSTSQHIDDPYHQTLASPQFWKDLKEFLDGRFGKEKGGRAGDEEVAFEEFLRSAKGSLSPHEIARIRDVVGITGMGGN